MGFWLLEKQMEHDPFMSCVLIDYHQLPARFTQYVRAGELAQNAEVGELCHRQEVSCIGRVRFRRADWKREWLLSMSVCRGRTVRLGQDRGRFGTGTRRHIGWALVGHRRP